jgi:hypothetical protein
MPSKVFLSYRREDSAGHTGRLYDHVVQALGRERVFFDIDSLEPGADFVRAIDEVLTQCAAVVVVIGPRWTEIRDAHGNQRLTDAFDLHRMEIERALLSGVRVIPVLVAAARMPEAHRLPLEIRALAARHAFRLDDARFREDAVRLTAFLDKLVTGSGAPPSATATPPEAFATRKRGESNDPRQPPRRLARRIRMAGRTLLTLLRTSQSLRTLTILGRAILVIAVAALMGWLFYQEALGPLVFSDR